MSIVQVANMTNLLVTALQGVHSDATPHLHNKGPPNETWVTEQNTYVVLEFTSQNFKCAKAEGTLECLYEGHL